MSVPPDEFPLVAAAVRSGINDAYRLGLGVAIQTMEEYRTRTTDPYTFEAVLAHLRELFVSARKCPSDP